MTGSTLTDIVHRLPLLLSTEALGSLTDAQLIERFVASRDEAAFALLAERHGRLVLGAARQVLRDRHAAEDVFQAAFLMLARKAGTLRDGQAIRAWLYETTVNLSRTVRAAAARRQNHERQTARDAMSDSTSTVTLDEFQSALHEEVSRLPEKFRLPVLLCHLDGKTHDEAAAALNWPLGTVRSRLSRARDLLRRRLERRGVTLAALALGTLPGSVANAVPLLLAIATVRSALAFAAGPASAPGGASGSAWALAEGALRHGAVRLKLLAATLMVIGLLSAEIGPAQNSREEVAPPVGERVRTITPPMPEPESQASAKKDQLVMMKDEVIEITPVLDTRFVPTFRNISPKRDGQMKCCWTTNMHIDRGRLWADLGLNIGFAPTLHAIVHEFVVYQPPDGCEVVSFADVPYITDHSDSFIYWSSDSFFTLSEWLSEAITEGWVPRELHGVENPLYRRYIEKRPYRSVLVTGDLYATDEENKLGAHVSFNPVRLVVRSPAQK